MIHSATPVSGFYVAWNKWLDVDFGAGNLHKVGYSSNLARRLNDSSYVTCFAPGSWRYVFTFEAASKEDAFLLETAVLHCCRHRRLGTSELVRMRADEIAHLATTIAGTLKLLVTRRDHPTYALPVKMPETGASTKTGGGEHHGPELPSQWLTARPLVDQLTLPAIHAEVRVEPVDMDSYVDELLADDCSTAPIVVPATSHVKSGISAALSAIAYAILPSHKPPAPKALPALAKPATPLPATPLPAPAADDGVAVDLLLDEFADGEISAVEESPFNVAAQSPLETRPYQADAIAQCIAELRANNKAILQMACRCGKTPVAYGVVREYLNPRLSRALTEPVCALYLVPGLALLRQTAQKLASYGFQEPMLLVGSDSRPVRIGKDKELTMTTDLAVIRSFVGERGCRLVISTYQSSPQVPTDVFDLAVFDECHRVCGGDAARPFNHFIMAPQVGARLFLTATPAYDPPTKSPITMKDRGRFGGVAYRYHLRQGISAGFVNDFRLEIVAGAVDVTDPDAAIPQQILVAMSKVDKLLVFCRDIKHSEKLCAALKEAQRDLAGVKPFACLIAHSRMTGSVATVLREFSEPGQRSVLFNCRLFQEGVEIPALNAIFFAAPRHSPRDIIQSLCRPLNRTSDKPISVIFLPVLHDPLLPPEDPANLKRYASIVPFVDALLDEDPRLYEHLLDPIGKPYPIDALGTHALAITDAKKKAVLLGAVRRAVRYGSSTSARQVDRILRVGNVPWDWVYGQIKYVVEKCNRYPKNGEARVIGGQKVSFHRFYRWAADEYIAYKEGKSSKLEPHQIHDLEKLSQWTIYGIWGPYPHHLCVEFLEQFLQEQGVDRLLLNIQNGGYIGLDATAMERLSGFATLCNQHDGKLRKGKPGTGFTMSAEKQRDLDRICTKFGLRWRKERDENGELVEGGPKTFIQEAYDRFKNYVKAHGADSELIQRLYPQFPHKHAHMESDEVVAGKLAPPKMNAGRRPPKKKE